MSGVERERDGGEELSRQNTGPVLLDKEAIVGWLKGCAVLDPQVRRSEWRKQAEEGITVCVRNSLSSAATTLATFRWPGVVWQLLGIKVYRYNAKGKEKVSHPTSLHQEAHVWPIHVECVGL